MSLHTRTMPFGDRTGALKSPRVACSHTACTWKAVLRPTIKLDDAERELLGRAGSRKENGQ